MKARVIKTTGKWYLVKNSDSSLIECRLKGKFRTQGLKSTSPIVVGDMVEIKNDSSSWMIVRLLERKNCIVRKSVKLSKQTHIIASNIDQAILMITLKNPVTSTGFIDRFLLAASSYNIPVMLLFNKLDIYNDKLLFQQKELARLYKSIGYDVLGFSVLNDDLSKLKRRMKKKINVICGHSGVGKSTLINSLDPNLNIYTKEISKIHKQGQHATTFTELYDLEFGASIIDTPGIRGFGIIGIDQSEIGDLFPDFFALRKKCKYYNCIHQNEPGCAVKLALLKGEIAESRYNNYLNLLEDKEEDYR